MSLVNNLFAQSSDPFSEFEDTLAIVNDGADTIFYVDDTSTELEYKEANNNKLMIANSNTTELLNLGVVSSSLISIKPGSNPESINKMQYGVNVSGMFDVTALPIGEPYTQLQWQALSDMMPEVLRFPSGEYGEFAHALHNLDGTNAKGYGYDLVEIYNYFDRTDNNLQPKTLSEILLIDYDDLKNFMDSMYVFKFDNFRTKYNFQEDISDTTRYIDHFIRLIKKIEVEHPGHRVKIIYCLNITTETASECKNIIQYLRSNPIHNCLVEGVEMGNEFNDKFHCKVMGMSSVDAYLNYLNGGTNTDINTQHTYFNSPDTVYNDHNYIKTFKGNAFFYCKIGLCAASHENTSGLALRSNVIIDCGVGANTWNGQLENHYNDSILVEGILLPTYRKQFDAVIIHPYYSADNYDTIPVTELNSTYYTCGSFPADKWSFSSYDARLQGAFDGVLTEGIKLNFKNLIATKYLDSYKAYNDSLRFDYTGINKKALWTTEWNMKDDDGNNSAFSPFDKLMIQIYTNSFMHGMLIQEWWLKNVKLNYQSGYRKNFFTISTIQNYAGGAATALLSTADQTEIDTLDAEGVFDDLGFDAEDITGTTNFYVKRTPMLAMEILSVINKKHLEYLPSVHVVVAGETNLQPTIFVNEDKDTLYVFYTNTKSNAQNYVLNFTNYSTIYSPDADDVIASVATGYYVDALQPYSTAGKGRIYDINLCYTETDAAHSHPFELREITAFTNTPDCSASINAANRCLTAPANSFGYFAIPVAPYYKKHAQENTERSFTVYPNPANKEIYISSTISSEEIGIKIFSITGNLLYDEKQFLNTKIDITYLPAGIYVLEINNSSRIKFIKQ